MARVKRGVTAHRRHKRLLNAAEGRKGTRSRLIKPAHEALLHALAYATRDRKVRKRDMRAALDHPDQRRGPDPRHHLQPAHPRPQEGRDRARPQDPGRHRRPRRRDVRPDRRGRPRRLTARPGRPGPDHRGPGPSRRSSARGFLIPRARRTVARRTLPTVDLATLTGQLRALRDEALPRIAAAPDLAALDELDVDYLGRKGGALSGLMRGIGAAARRGPAARRASVVNEVREAVEGALAERPGARTGAAGSAARLAARDGRRHDARPADRARQPSTRSSRRSAGSRRSSASSGS